MRKNSSIQLKAFFLLAIFFLNTTIIFACVLGVNVNKGHHIDAAGRLHSATHQASGLHHHGKVNHDDLDSDKHNSCKGRIVKFEQGEKNLSPDKKASFDPPVLLLSLSCIPYVYLANSYSAKRKQLASPPYYHLPVPDIRIAIQSFLI